MNIPGLNPVRYLTSRDLPPTRDTGYDYIMAGNGLFKRARNRHVEACICIAPAPIAGLPDIPSYIAPRFPSIPAAMLATALADARRDARDVPREAMYHVYHTATGRLRLAKPKQRATAARVRYAGGDNADIALDLHSHCEAGASFSATDDGDELGFRFYAVMAYIFTRPTLTVRLGIYGDHVDVNPLLVFGGLGPFERDRFEANPHLAYATVERMQRRYRRLTADDYRRLTEGVWQ